MSFLKKILRKKDKTKSNNGSYIEDDEIDQFSDSNHAFRMSEGSRSELYQKGSQPVAGISQMKFEPQVDPILAQQQQIQQQMLMMSLMQQQQQPKIEKHRSKYELSEEENFYLDILKDDFNEVQEDVPQSQESSANDITHSKTDKNQNLGRWTDEEHQLFLDGLKIYGKDWEAIQNHIGTRDTVNIRSHAQKFTTKLKKSIENNDGDPDSKFYYSVLKEKMSKPIKRKRKNKKETEPEEEEDDDYDDDEFPKGNIFMVVKDQKAVQKKIAFNNIQPSQILQQDMQDTAFQKWKNQFSRKESQRSNNVSVPVHDNQSMNSDEIQKPTALFGLLNQGTFISNPNSSGSRSSRQRATKKSDSSGASGGSAMSLEKEQTINNIIAQQQMHHQIQLQQQIESMNSNQGSLNMKIRIDEQHLSIPPMITQFNQYKYYNFVSDQIPSTTNVNQDEISMEGRSDNQQSLMSEENILHSIDVLNVIGQNNSTNRRQSGNGTRLPQQNRISQETQDPDEAMYD